MTFQIDEHKTYFTKLGDTRLGISSQNQLEQYVLNRVVLALHPSQPGEQAWSEQDLLAQFAPDRYLWGRTVHEAIARMVRDARKMEADSR